MHAICILIPRSVSLTDAVVQGVYTFVTFVEYCLLDCFNTKCLFLTEFSNVTYTFKDKPGKKEIGGSSLDFSLNYRAKNESYITVRSFHFFTSLVVLVFYLRRQLNCDVSIVTNMAATLS